MPQFLTGLTMVPTVQTDTENTEGICYADKKGSCKLMFTHIQTLSHYKSCPQGNQQPQGLCFKSLMQPHIEHCLTQTQKSKCLWLWLWQLLTLLLQTPTACGGFEIMVQGSSLWECWCEQVEMGLIIYSVLAASSASDSSS